MDLNFEYRGTRARDFRRTRVDHSRHKIAGGTDGSRTVWPLEQAGFEPEIPLGATTRDNRVRSLGGEAFGDERCVRRPIRDIRRRRGSFFLDLSEQPHPRHVGPPALAPHDRRRDGGP